jgi:ATP-binding cassette subfamily B protein
MLHRLTRLGVDYYDRELPGQVAARAVYDLDRVSDLLTEQNESSQGPLYAFMTSVAVLTMTIAAMFFFSIPIALIALLFVPALIGISVGFLPVADRAYDRQRAELGRTIARLQEDFAGRHVIHGYVAEDRSQAEFWAMARELRRAQRWAQFCQNSYDALIWFTIDLAGAAVLWRAGTLVLAGAISVGVLVVMREYIDRALAPIPRATRAFRYYLISKASLHTLREPFRAPINPPERDDAVLAPRLAGEIVFQDVEFTYPGTTRHILHDVSFTVAPGEVVAMVGPTGAGKSSIAKLVGRTYDPDAGAVLADGVDLRTYEIGSYRSRLGIVPQDAFCFRGTVASNIAYGRPSASREEVEDAARAVGAHATLMSVPGGFDGVVEEEGRNLTAAQRQMMALARAWLAGPDLLILDEATSTLSVELEQKVLDAIGPLNCTTMFITHRLGVAKRAGRVVVIDEGRVVEEGTHDELINAGGAYSALWSVGTEVEGTRTITQRTGADEPTVTAPGA